MIHVVRPGESIYAISRRYGVPYGRIIAENEIANPNRLAVGQTLVIPGRPTGGPAKRTIDVNGYVLPNIDRGVLTRTLANLTFLSIFSYQVLPNGTFTPVPNDDELIRLARNASVGPLMVISNISGTGGFSSDLVSGILNNAAIQDRLINNVIAYLRQKNFYGLDIDFEFIYPRDREAYNRFLSKIVARVRAAGFIVATALAPKTSATQSGLLYEAHDYPFHGVLLDHVILMTYEWGYVAGPPLAVAPINEVKKVLDYAVTVIPRRKILMGIPNYGYDWTLPYRPGTRAETLSIQNALNRAVTEQAAIQYDTTAQAPFYNYRDDQGRNHVVWFEDARSIAAKLALVETYRLGGISIWTLNRFFPQSWLVLNEMYNVRKIT